MSEQRLNITDGFGTNPIVTDNGDGTITLSNDQGQTLDIDICATVNATPCGGGGIYSSFISHSVTWHHDAGTPSKDPFMVNLANQRLGNSSWLSDRYAHQFFGPSGNLTLRIIYSNDEPTPLTLNVQEILESEFNTDFNAAPKTAIIGSTVLQPGNGVVDIPVTATAGNGVERASVFYYYAPVKNDKIRIMGVSITA